MKYKTIKKVFISLLAIGLLSLTSSSFAKKEAAMEKCTGIAAKGKGDGKVTIDGKTVEWLLLPAGKCEKLVGGEIYLDNK